MVFDETCLLFYLVILVSYDMRSVYSLRFTSTFPIFFKYLRFLSNYLLDRSNMDWVLLSKKYLTKKIGGDIGTMVDLLYVVLLSMGMFLCVLV